MRDSDFWLGRHLLGSGGCIAEGCGEVPGFPSKCGKCGAWVHAHKVRENVLMSECEICGPQAQAVRLELGLAPKVGLRTAAEMTVDGNAPLGEPSKPVRVTFVTVGPDGSVRETEVDAHGLKIDWESGPGAVLKYGVDRARDSEDTGQTIFGFPVRVWRDNHGKSE